jgi:hypothetical protein
MRAYAALLAGKCRYGVKKFSSEDADGTLWEGSYLAGAVAMAELPPFTTVPSHAT